MKYLPVMASAQSLSVRPFRALRKRPCFLHSLALLSLLLFADLGWPTPADVLYYLGPAKAQSYRPLNSQARDQVRDIEYGGSFLAPLSAQSINNNKDNFKPVPYGKDEFPMFLQQVRRFEVILIGSIPITLLFGSLIYDILYSVTDPNINGIITATDNDSILGKIGISISVSGLLAVIDMAIHLGHRGKERKERERILRDSEFIGGGDSAKPGGGPDEAEREGPGEEAEPPGGAAVQQGN
ncbi:hypothetical protein P0082_03045 [Candidatus Haliotispira prima]|uniref:MotA/TolQ/ExbB proton channel domain-containing protein n=1 Tax=Candidatus Haliotispira prima TaxID=3034016 RepID=A0ABY8MIK9_9SPIO|nr:hypothetical protein P0082_03045 [Candidatus Haliotispira prima]